MSDAPHSGVSACLPFLETWNIRERVLGAIGMAMAGPLFPRSVMQPR
jgi:hypothetical protein